MQSATKVRLNAAVPQAAPCACKQKRKTSATARFGLPINGTQGRNYSSVVWCSFSVRRVPFCLLDIYTNGEELCLKSRPKVQRLRRFKTTAQKWPNLHIISSPFPFNPGKQNNYGVRESLPTLAVASFFFSAPPFHALRQGIIGFRCAISGAFQ